MKLWVLCTISFFLSIASAKAQVVFSKSGELVLYDSTRGYYEIIYKKYDGTSGEGYFIPGNEVVPDVEALITYDKGKNVYSYDYSISNDGSARRSIYRFALALESEADMIKGPSGWVVMNWLRNRPETSSDALEIISWQYSNIYGGRTGIASGQEMSGFGISSSGLPSIRRFYASNVESLNYPEEDAEPPEPTGGANAYVFDLMYNEESRFVENFTVGPEDLSDSLSVVEFIELIIDYNSEAGWLGWIDNKEMFERFDQQLVQARGYLINEQYDEAVTLLSEFATELKALDADGLLRDEAFALLYFNIKYLLDRIDK